MTLLVTDQFVRLLDSLPSEDPWPALEASGFLDLLRPEAEGGAGLSLEDLFPLALAVGARPEPPPIIETIVARLVRPGAIAVADVERALVLGGVAGELARGLAAAVAAAQMAGAMSRLLDLTVDYATTRRQFGREIGKFQAVQQQVALLAEEVIAARMAAQMALRGPPLDLPLLAAGLAKARAGQAASVACAIAHAVHGAIGISQEHVLHRYAARLHQWRRAHGGESYWNARLGAWALAAGGDVLTLARGL